MKFSDIKIVAIHPWIFFNWPSNSNLATVLVLPWVYVAITKIKHFVDNCSGIFTLHTSAYNSLPTEYQITLILERLI